MPDPVGGTVGQFMSTPSTPHVDSQTKKHADRDYNRGSNPETETSRPVLIGFCK